MTAHVAFNVDIMKNLLVVNAKIRKNVSHIRGVIMSAVSKACEDPEESLSAMQNGSLIEFYRRFGHLHYDSIERLAKDPASGIEITDPRRENCLTCA